MCGSGQELRVNFDWYFYILSYKVSWNIEIVAFNLNVISLMIIFVYLFIFYPLSGGCVQPCIHCAEHVCRPQDTHIRLCQVPWGHQGHAAKPQQDHRNQLLPCPRGKTSSPPLLLAQTMPALLTKLQGWKCEGRKKRSAPSENFKGTQSTPVILCSCLDIMHFFMYFKEYATWNDDHVCFENVSICINNK